MKILATLIFFSFIVPITAFSQQEGPNSPASSENQPYASCTTCAGAIWDSTENIYSNDGLFSEVHLDPYLTCFQSTCYRSRYLTAYNFDFDIPQNATIEGITVDVFGVPSQNAAVRDCTIVLRRDNSNNVYGNNMAQPQPWNVNNPQHTYGGPTELWGETWIPDDINSPEFGVYVKLYNPTNNSKDVFVDAVEITVTYSIGLTVYSVTSSPKPVSAYHDATSQILNVDLNVPVNSQAEIRITDMFGRVCMSELINTSNGDKFQFSTAFLAEGMYTCTVVCGDEVWAEKFVR